MDKKVSTNFTAFAALKAKGIRQKEIAARCGVSPAAVSQVLNGKACSQKIRVAIAEAVNLPVEELFPLPSHGEGREP